MLCSSVTAVVTPRELLLSYLRAHLWGRTGAHAHAKWTRARGLACLLDKRPPKARVMGISCLITRRARRRLQGINFFSAVKTVCERRTGKSMAEMECQSIIRRAFDRRHRHHHGSKRASVSQCLGRPASHEMCCGSRRINQSAFGRPVITSTECSSHSEPFSNVKHASELSGAHNSN